MYGIKYFKSYDSFNISVGIVLCCGIIGRTYYRFVPNNIIYNSKNC